jgi:hypothetical protein
MPSTTRVGMAAAVDFPVPMIHIPGILQYHIQYIYRNNYYSSVVLGNSSSYSTTVLISPIKPVHTVPSNSMDSTAAPN